MSEAKPLNFPRFEQAPTTPDWLDPAHAGKPVRSLLSHLGHEQPEAANDQTHPEAEPAPPQPPPAYEPEPPPFEVHADEQPRPNSRLPPPPKLGSLIPGARSNPPPANDAGHASLKERADAFANAAIELAIARAATLAVLEGQLLDLSIEIATAVIEREVESEPALHTALARAALNSLGDARNVTLRTSPDGYATICAALGGEEVDVRGVRVHVVADASLPGLGCVVDGENVRIDASVSERLRAVRRAFEEERRKSLENVE